MNRIFAIVVSLLVIAGCAAAKPNYTYNANADDPVLIINSDFYLRTYFYVKIDPTSDRCTNFQWVGNISHNDSIFSPDPLNEEIQITVPADQEITIEARHDYRDPNKTSICGPLYMSFTPKKGKIYKVVMHEIGKMCTLTISDISDTPSPVKTKRFKCKY